MMLCSIFTPYYSEDVMYSKAQLEDKNVDGITILYYLQTIVPGFAFIPNFPCGIALFQWHEVGRQHFIVVFFSKVFFF